MKKEKTAETTPVRMLQPKELEDLKQLQAEKENIKNELIQLSITRIDVQKRQNDVARKMEKLSLDETQSMEKLREVYGDIQIDLNTGQIHEIETPITE